MSFWVQNRDSIRVKFTVNGTAQKHSPGTEPWTPTPLPNPSNSSYLSPKIPSKQEGPLFICSTCDGTGAECKWNGGPADYAVVHAHRLSNKAYREAVNLWRTRLSAGGVIAGSHYFNRSLGSAALLAVGGENAGTEAWRVVYGSNVADEESEGGEGQGAEDSEEKMSRLVESSLEGGSSLMGVRGIVDEVFGSTGCLGVTQERQGRWWYAQQEAEDCL